MEDAAEVDLEKEDPESWEKEGASCVTRKDTLRETVQNSEEEVEVEDLHSGDLMTGEEEEEEDTHQDPEVAPDLTREDLCTTGGEVAEGILAHAPRPTEVLHADHHPEDLHVDHPQEAHHLEVIAHNVATEEEAVAQEVTELPL